MPSANCASMSSADLLLDTSAAIALIVRSSDAHQRAIDRTRGLHLGLAGHAQFETYSVLTRLPGELRVSGATASRLIRENFPAGVFLSEDASASALAELQAAGIVGGAVYDGLVALAARASGVTLLTTDRRAAPTYGTLGTSFELL